MGIIVTKAVVFIDKWLQKFRKADELMEDFVALSTILLVYSITELVNGYGFIAVFVAGIVVRRSYHDPEKQQSKFEFTEQIERLLEVATILLLGSILQLKPILSHLNQGLLIAVLLLF